MTIKTGFLRVFAKIMVFCVAMTGVFFTPAYADDACKNLLNPANIINGTLIGSNVNSADIRVATNDLIPVTPGQQYTVSVYDANGAVNPDFTIYEIYGYNDAGVFINNVRTSAATSAQNVAFTVPGTSVNIRFSIKRVDGAPIAPADVQVQLEKGSTATSYVPYNPLCATCDGIIKTYESAVGTVAQNGTPTPTNPIEPTFYTQGDMILRKVGNYADSYDVTTGKITRRVGVKVLNGTESFSTNVITSCYALTPYIGAGNFDDKTVYSSHLKSTAAIPAFGSRDGYAFIVNASDDYTLVFGGTGTWSSPSAFKQFLAQQYANGTPVTVYYPLATPVEETVTQTTYCAAAIKIATTAYNNNAFSSVQTALNNAVTAIKDVVSNTIAQAAAVQSLQTAKQTMPDASDTDGTCPRFRQCLLIQDPTGKPHWYQIKDPVRDLVLSLKNNKVNSAGETTTTAYAANGYDGTNGTTDSRYYKGYPAMRLKTTAASSSVYTRQFSSTLLNGANGGQYKTLGDQEWAVTWDGAETGTAGSFLPGVIYGTSRCAKTKPSSTAVGTPGWTTIENSDALNDLENIESYVQCYCKMTGVGMDGEITPVKDSSAAPWVFSSPYSSAGDCATYCAYGCAISVRVSASFRNSVMGWAVQ